MQAWRGTGNLQLGTKQDTLVTQPHSGGHTELASIPRNAIPRISLQRSHRRVEFTHKSRAFDLVTCIACLESQSSSSGKLVT